MALRKLPESPGPTGQKGPSDAQGPALSLMSDRAGPEERFPRIPGCRRAGFLRPNVQPPPKGSSPRSRPLRHSESPGHSSPVPSGAGIIGDTGVPPSALLECCCSLQTCGGAAEFTLQTTERSTPNSCRRRAPCPQHSGAPSGTPGTARRQTPAQPALTLFLHKALVSRLYLPCFTHQAPGGRRLGRGHRAG